MYSLHLNLILLGLPHIPLLTAEYLLRAKPPAPTIAPLFRRQDETICGAGATSCNDGGPGCCDYGQQCTFDEHHVPLCQGACNGGPTCSGVFDGHCCNQGFTCNYQSTLCEFETTFPITTSMTNAPSPTSPNATPSNTHSTPQAAPATPLTQSTPQRTISSTPPQASPQSAITPSSQSSPPSSSLTSDVSTSTSAFPSPIPPVIGTAPSTQTSSRTSSTPVQPGSTTATVNSISGATGASSIAVFRLSLLYFGLGMMTIV